MACDLKVSVSVQFLRISKNWLPGTLTVTTIWLVTTVQRYETITICGFEICFKFELALRNFHFRIQKMNSLSAGFIGQGYALMIIIQQGEKLIQRFSLLSFYFFAITRSCPI